MLLLDTLPSRQRSKSYGPEYDNLGAAWRSHGSTWGKVKQTCLTYDEQRIMYDEKTPRFAFKPCYAESYVIRATPAKFSDTIPVGNVCNMHGLCPRSKEFAGHESTYLDGPSSGYSYMTLPDIASTRAVQDALNSVLGQYYDHMYTIKNDLPDMTVFFKELSDFVRAWQQIVGLARGLANPVRKYVTKGDKKLRGKAGEIASIVGVDRINGNVDMSDIFVGYNFGIAAPLRDICSILTEILAKIDALVPDGRRRTERFTRMVHWTDTTPLPNLGGLCYGVQCHKFLPSTRVGRKTTRDIEVRISITSVMERHLDGSAIEKAIAAVLGVLGLLPNVETIWEMTKLSWMIDYIFRTDKLFRALGLYGISPVRPVVLSECCSISVKQKLTIEQIGCVYENIRGSRISEYNTYERALGTYPLESLLSYGTYPDLKEAALAAAVAKQLLS